MQYKAHEIVCNFTDGTLEEQTQAQQWFEGEDVRMPSVYKGRGKKTYLRIKGDFIETSNGYKVPVDSAEDLWEFVNSVEDGQHKPMKGNTLPDYPVKSVIGGKRLRVSCQILPLSELTRLAKELKFI